MKLCLFTTIFKDDTIEDTIKAAKKIGYDALEIRALSHLPLESPVSRAKEIKDMAESEDLDVVCLYTASGGYSHLEETACQKQLDDLKIYTELARGLGAGMIMHMPGGPRPEEAKEADFKKAAEWMNKAADITEQAGIKIVMEIHMNGLIETAVSSLKLLNLINRDNVGLIYDAGNMYICHTDYGTEAVKLLRDKIFHFHVKNEKQVESKIDASCFEFKGEFFRHSLLGDGGVDHLPLFQALEETGYKGYLSCECHEQIHEPYFRAEYDYKKVKELLRKGAIS